LPAARSDTIRVVHVTAHLGGGVGRVLSQLARRHQQDGAAVQHLFICLEPPQTSHYVDVLTQCGSSVVVAPDEEQLSRLLAEADIVQLEWWHHPLLAAWMCQRGLRARLVVWAHTSGLHYPAIPPAFVGLPHAFLFTTGASLPPAGVENIVQAVSSSGGFDDLPEVQRGAEGPLRFGYLGSLNPAKLHPDVAQFLAAVREPGFQVAFYGEPGVNPALEERPDPRIRLCGYTSRPAEALRELGVFVYLLNPTHYGTTENALLEAMACGVVPVVLDNPVEASIVEHGRTGMVVRSPEDFAQAIATLAADPGLRLRMAAECSRTVRERFGGAQTAAAMADIYRRVMGGEPRAFDFRPIFGERPSQWFRSCLGAYADCFDSAAARERRLALPFLYERSKGSVFQFQRAFPDDAELARWAGWLENDLKISEPA